MRSTALFLAACLIFDSGGAAVFECGFLPAQSALHDAANVCVTNQALSTRALAMPAIRNVIPAFQVRLSWGGLALRKADRVGRQPFVQTRDIRRPAMLENYANARGGLLTVLLFWGIVVGQKFGLARRARQLAPNAAEARKVIANYHPSDPHTLVPWLNAEETAHAIADGNATFFEKAEDTVNARQEALRKSFQIAGITAILAVASAILLGVGAETFWNQSDDLCWFGIGFLTAVTSLAAYMTASTAAVLYMGRSVEAQVIQQAQYYRVQSQWARLPERWGFRTTEEASQALKRPYLVVRVTKGERKNQIGVVVGMQARGACYRIIFLRHNAGGRKLENQVLSTPSIINKSDTVPVHFSEAESAMDQLQILVNRNERIRKKAYHFLQNELFSDLDTAFIQALRSGPILPAEPEVLRFYTPTDRSAKHDVRTSA